jgi:hypothetical protein
MLFFGKRRLMTFFMKMTIVASSVWSSTARRQKRTKTGWVILIIENATEGFLHFCLLFSRLCKHEYIYLLCRLAGNGCLFFEFESNTNSSALTLLRTDGDFCRGSTQKLANKLRLSKPTQCSAPACRHWSTSTTTQPKK